eukprot:9264491-Alexandrium_andersonii.AAC.1
MAACHVSTWPILGHTSHCARPRPHSHALATCLPYGATPHARYTSVCAGHRGTHIARWCLGQGA